MKRALILIFSVILCEPVFADHGVRIIGADWGTRGRFCDATFAVAERCEGTRECQVVASNHLCGDPFKGKVKTLRVRYHCGGPERFEEAREDHSVHLHCRGRRGAAGRELRRVARGGLEIGHAVYGIGRKYCDATPALAVACDGAERCAVTADNRLCGDPFRGKHKQLEVEYYCRGRRFHEIVAEDRVARLECR